MWHKASTLAKGGPRKPPTFAATVAVGLLALAAFAPSANAGQPVTQALNPAPPDVYTCSATGGGTICRATTTEPYALQPTGIVCGSGAGEFEALDSGTRQIHAIRYYDRNGNLTRRIRNSLFVGGHLTNPLTGATIDYVQHNTDVDELAIPGDFASDTFTGHGVLAITVPGSGAVILEAGRTIVGPGGDIEFQAGPTDLSDYFGGDAGVVSQLCEALGAA